jgi:SAM-dependent methyltransferase
LSHVSISVVCDCLAEAANVNREPLSGAIGTTGKLYEVEFAPKLVEHLQQRRMTTKVVAPIEIKHNDHRSIGFGGQSNVVDVVFSVDTYHHFEYFETILADIHKALTPNGRMVMLLTSPPTVTGFVFSFHALTFQ